MKDGFMAAGKPKNRLELRRQYEAAEPLDPMEDEADELAEESDDEEQPERKPKKKVKPASRAKTAKAAKPAARMRVVWTVVNDAFKPVGTFEYSQKEAALARAAELTAKGKGTHFVQKVKEPMPDDAPGLGAGVLEAAKPAAKPKPARAPKAAAKRPAREETDDEESDDDDDTEPAENEDD
jgi:hypothetical protein